MSSFGDHPNNASAGDTAAVAGGTAASNASGGGAAGSAPIGNANNNGSGNGSNAASFAPGGINASGSSSIIEDPFATISALISTAVSNVSSSAASAADSASNTFEMRNRSSSGRRANFESASSLTIDKNSDAEAPRKSGESTPTKKGRSLTLNFSGGSSSNVTAAPAGAASSGTPSTSSSVNSGQMMDPFENGYEALKIQLMDMKVPVSVVSLDQWLFGDDSPFMQKFLGNVQRFEDITMEPWTESGGQQTRNFSYVMGLNGPVGPKSTKVLIKQTYLKRDLPHFIHLEHIGNTPDVPSGDCFTTISHYCISQIDAENCRLLSSGQIKFTKSTWIKTFVETHASEGLVRYAQSLQGAIESRLRSDGIAIEPSTVTEIPEAVATTKEIPESPKVPLWERISPRFIFGLALVFLLISFFGNIVVYNRFSHMTNQIALLDQRLDQYLHESPIIIKSEASSLWAPFLQDIEKNLGEIEKKAAIAQHHLELVINKSKNKATTKREPLSIKGSSKGEL